MADRPASAISIRGTTTDGNNTALTIKVTRYDLDFEQRIRRVITSDGYFTSQNAPVDGAVLSYTTVIECNGGVLRATGFVDPSNATVAYIINTIGFTSSALNLKNVYFYIDILKESSGSRYGYNFGVTTADGTPNNTQCAKLIPMRLTGITDEGGMTELDFELHSQGVAVEFVTNLT